jgi:hypothetical protein
MNRARPYNLLRTRSGGAKNRRMAYDDDNMAINTPSEGPGDLKTFPVDMALAKGASFERLPDEIIEQ